ncbi:V-type ATP synthase subunit I [Legionella massiliensis]|uniref:V-type ATP synthase subunit I n=1 Tax=Legionella massiliensis TaxID=1034943 RepID=A0A078L1B5_9GAMM|nr:V-type ATPase 116kDa subunit family protein [Legionella massiliensis]CDZ78971.1 V-type ATP synthase subunit I [Legionella massiliensis]CEE14709.1 V-type ATP synthase subunit I [Legionella massiliensis]
MSIAKFKKISLLGLSQSKKEIINALQGLGCMHLIAINPPSKKALTTSSTTLLDEIKSALRYLKDSPQQGRARLHWHDFSPDKIVKQILANQSALRAMIDRHDFLEQRTKDLAELGQFELPPEECLAGIKLWFYKISVNETQLIPKEIPAQEIYRNNRYIFIALLATTEPQDEQLCARRIHTGSVCLNSLYVELELVNEKIDDLVDERRNLTRYRYLLSLELAQFSDRTQLKKALDKTQDHDDFFLLQGWLPQSQLVEVQQFCEQNQLALTIEDPLEGELPPTLLESNSWLAGGRELVSFYQIPGYHSLDPSIMVFFSFSLFFAMIMADAGYGLILALFTLVSWKWLGRYNGAKWLRPLLISISSFSIVYGVLLGSYWGVEPKAGTWLAELKIININNFNAMMALVIVIGCLHICLGSAMRAWFSTQLNERLQALGFILFIIAALVFSLGLAKHHNSLKELSYVLFLISLLMIMIFASNEPVTGFKSLVKRIFHSLAALYELPSLLGDILSYLRLFALGLAGASLAITFNTLAMHIGHSTSWVLAIIVLLIGQTMNFALCLMGAVIHGLRLNYIEFFKWALKEDGYIYQPFKKQEISHE